MMESGLVPTLVFLMSLRVLASKIETLLSRPLLVNPRPRSLAIAMPCTLVCVRNYPKRFHCREIDHLYLRRVGGVEPLRTTIDMRRSPNSHATDFDLAFAL